MTQRIIQILLGTLLLISTLTFAQTSPLTNTNIAGPLQGSTPLANGTEIRWDYHFDRNALKDAQVIGDTLLALTRSGNLISFDAKTLSLIREQIVPGRGTAIALGNSGTLLVGTQEGSIFEADPQALNLQLICKAKGMVTWLTVGAVPGFTEPAVVAVMDSSIDIYPWPGEQNEHYRSRSERLERKAVDPYQVLIHTKNYSKYFAFSRTGMALPGTFLLDKTGRLWMGTDKGEWGGEYSWMDLRTGKTKVFETPSGVLGFYRTPTNRMLAFGGMSHLGMSEGFVTDISSSSTRTIAEFSNRAAFLAAFQSKAQSPQAEAEIPDERPSYPIDHLFEDETGKGFWISSAHTIFHCDRDFKEWKKLGDLGGRWTGGRALSVGNTPTVHRLLVVSGNPTELVAVTGRDGLIRASERKIEDFVIKGQIEGSVVEIWPTSLGNVFLNSSDMHEGWRFDGTHWSGLRFYPERRPRAEGENWYFAQPILDDGGIVSYYGSSSTPGERGFLRVNNEGTRRVLQSWSDQSSFYGSALLGTTDGRILEISDAIREWDGSVWKNVGNYSGTREVDRIHEFVGRRYITLAHDGNLELVLDAALGDVLQLSHSDEGYELKQATTSSGKKLEGVFDALQDGEGDIFLTTSTDLSRFHSSTSKQEFISKPNNVEEFKSIARDTDGRLWVVGDHLYVSSDSGGHWQMVNLPMLGPTQSKRVRPIGGNEKGIAIALDDRGVVFLRW